jgi:adenylate cyclase class 2
LTRLAIETEIKVRAADLGELRRRLESLGGRLVAPRHFEDNYVLDFADGAIRSRAALLRVRNAGENWVVTYKGAALPEGPFKSREELETGIADGPTALEILGRLGLRVWFRYQKYREDWGAGSEGQQVLVSLDETPVGSFAELEGTGDAIRRLAAALGFRETDFIRDSYYTLHVRACTERGESAAHMLFPGRS